MRHTRLTTAYKQYNRKYFEGRLPDISEVDVHWEDFTENLMGYQLGYEIAINRKHRYADPIWRLTLLHEMTHLDTPSGPAHGKKFQAKMLGLAKAGALKDLW